MTWIELWISIQCGAVALAGAGVGDALGVGAPVAPQPRERIAPRRERALVDDGRGRSDLRARRGVRLRCGSSAGLPIPREAPRGPRPAAAAARACRGPSVERMRIVPPCSSVSDLAMASPRPEPWWLLVSWLSTCSNGRPSLASASLRDADAGVERWRSAPKPRRARARIVMRPPSGVNLTALERRLSTICLSRRGSASSRMPRRDVGGERELLVVGARGDDPHGVVEEAAERGPLEVEADAAGLDLRHVEDVVDDVEQVLAALVDVAAIFAVFVRAERAEHALTP